MLSVGTVSVGNGGSCISARVCSGRSAESGAGKSGRVAGLRSAAHPALDRPATRGSRTPHAVEGKQPALRALILCPCFACCDVRFSDFVGSRRLHTLASGCWASSRWVPSKDATSPWTQHTWRDLTLNIRKSFKSVVQIEISSRGFSFLAGF